MYVTYLDFRNMGIYNIQLNSVGCSLFAFLDLLFSLLQPSLLPKRLTSIDYYQLGTLDQRVRPKGSITTDWMAGGKRIWGIYSVASFPQGCGLAVAVLLYQRLQLLSGRSFL